jgi:hypothetical protein
MSTADILIPETQVDTYGLTLIRNPEHVIEQALIAGKALQRVVEANNWSIRLGGTNPHLKIEGAEFLGQQYGVTARIVSGMTQYIELGEARGWTAEAETVDWSGRVRTRASAMCLSDEDNWSLRKKYEGRGENRKQATGDDGRPLFVPTPLFQLRSMAETRACSKAFRLLFGWIYTLHGFEATGAEEMVEHQRIRQPQAKQTDGNKITDPMRKRLWAIGKDGGKTNEDIAAVVRRHGFDSTNDITRDKYEEIVAELQKSDAAE